MKTTHKGATTLEYLVVLFVIFVLVSACMANAYFTEAGVLKELQGTCPGIKRILRTDRNVFARSVIMAETYDNAQVVYLLDSDVLFNYDLKLR